MTNKQLKDLKDTLWESADILRSNAHLKSSQYANPILGLIFLRFADVKYSLFEEEIKKEYEQNKNSRMAREEHEIAIEKCGFYLPSIARYDYLLNLPESENITQKVQNAMEEIEQYNPSLENTLPKDVYYDVVKQSQSVLVDLLKLFKNIPANVELDIFGEIYEYFLGKFALAEGQGGGEFFTPSSVVRYMVEVLAPTEGKILDPACGSGGMFVQTAHYIQRHKEKGKDINIRVSGVEKTGETVKLAKMNLALNDIRGDIVEANSYYDDPFQSIGNFDYVMANPPFNVYEVDLDRVIPQTRFNTYGIPQNKSKGKKNAKEKVPNANYLWINLFATALNEKGRAGLVMANSASDAGYSEKEIRKKLIESGIISQMVTLPSNMFISVTLPATLWFFNKVKKERDEILFIDARNIFTKIDRAHKKFSEEQIKNLGIITRLYEGNTGAFTDLINEYKEKQQKAPEFSDDEDIMPKSYWQAQIDWLMERFPDGKYQDVIGLCKAAKIDGEDGIKDQDYSLNPGRYVGGVIEDDGMSEEEFKAEMLSLNAEFQELNNDARLLEQKITNNLLELFK